MIWLIAGGVAALLFGMYKAGPGSQKNNIKKQSQRQDQLRQAMEKYKYKTK